MPTTSFVLKKYDSWLLRLCVAQEGFELCFLLRLCGRQKALQVPFRFSFSGSQRWF